MTGGKWSVVRDQVVGGDETATKRNVWNDFVQHRLHQPSADIVWNHVKSCEISNFFFFWAGQDLISNFIIESWNIAPVLYS